MTAPLMDSSSSSEIDELLNSLNHPHRRAVIRYFENHAEGQAASVSELAAFITNRNSGLAEEEVTIQLLHNHLPKLASTDWLDFDRQRKHVRYQGLADSAPVAAVVRELLDG